METGKFYFIKDSFYEKFKDCGLLGNKNYDNNQLHSRPCFYCFEKDNFYWMIPISSKVNKYELIYNEKMKRYKGKFDGIRFGYVNGKKRAFLIQNMFPITEQYIEKKYMINNNTIDVSVNAKFAKELNSIIEKVIFLYQKDIKIVLTDLDYIMKSL